MAKKRSYSVAVLLSVSFCSFLLFLVVLVLTPAEIGKSYSPVGEGAQNIPYSSIPDNKAILILGEKGEGALLYLNFRDIVLEIHPFENGAEEKAGNLGYIIDYKMAVTNDFICDLADRIGGIEILTNGQTFRYLGSSLGQLLEKTPTFDRISVISEAFFEKFAKIDLSSADFMFIMENTNTDLNYNTCYEWFDFLPELVCNCIYK